MTTREKVAQLIVSQTDSYIFSEGHALMTDTLVGIEGIGGLLIIQDSLPRFLTRMNQLQEMSKIPLLVSIDGEWGPSMRFSEYPFFPQQMQLGALSDDSLIYEMGLAVAEQCEMVNIHINYAPVVDININPKNPVIHARSFGEDRDKVTQFARAYMQGMQDGGIVACSKHFPGHGDTEVDSHKGLPVLWGKKEGERISRDSRDYTWGHNYRWCPRLPWWIIQRQQGHRQNNKHSHYGTDSDYRIKDARKRCRHANKREHSNPARYPDGAD